MMPLLCRNNLTHGETNGCKLKLDSCMERRSCLETTSRRGGARKRCTAGNCKVSLVGGKNYLAVSTNTMPCV